MHRRNGLVLFLVVALMIATSTFGQDVYTEDVGDVVVRVVDRYLSKCHVVLLTTDIQSFQVSDIIRLMNEGVIVAAESMDKQNLTENIWGSSRACRALILHLSNNINNTNSALRLLERTGHWKHSETRVVVLGRRPYVKEVLLQHCFRNTAYALYIAIDYDNSVKKFPWQGNLVRWDYKEAASQTKARVWVYRRCLYCNNGYADVEELHHWRSKLNSINLSHNEGSLFYRQDELYNFRGHHFKYIAAQYFPYIDFPSREDDVAVPVNPYDSVDFRLADTMAQKENFTYTIYKEPHTSWGEDTDGVWSGLMGYLQREDVDMSTLVVPTDSRLKAASFTRNYPSDHIIIASLKPQPLPRHLALIRPFTGTVWIAVLLAVLVWVIMFWVLQRLSSRITGSPDLRFDTAFLYGWGVLMEVHPKVPTSATSGQVMVGWWLVFCMVIYTGYESALISHLTVNRASTQPPETFEDLLHADGWEWGLDSWLWTGMPLEYFTRHKDPVVMEIYKHLQIIDPLKGLKKILGGGFSLMTVKSMVTIQGSSYFGDDHGNTPFYISNKNVPIVTFFGWGFRLGAPFYHRFNKLNMQLDAAGILTLWLQKVTTKRIKDNRAKAELDGGTAFVEYTQSEEGHVVLGLDHLQGIFYLLFFGLLVSGIGLLGEILINYL